MNVSCKCEPSHPSAHSHLPGLGLPLAPESSFCEATIALEIVARKDWCGGAKFYYFVFVIAPPSLYPLRTFSELNLLKTFNTLHISSTDLELVFVYLQ